MTGFHRNPPLSTGAGAFSPDGSGASSVQLGNDGGPANSTNAVAATTGATAVGNQAKVTAGSTPGNYGTAVGASATTNGNDTVALGAFAKAVTDGDTALGDSSTASGGGSTAVGQTAFVSGASSQALGQGATVTHTRSTAIGNAATTQNDQCFVHHDILEVATSSGTTLQSGIVLYSPNGHRWLIRVDNTGVLSTTAL